MGLGFGAIVVENVDWFGDESVGTTKRNLYSIQGLRCKGHKVAQSYIVELLKLDRSS